MFLDCHRRSRFELTHLARSSARSYILHQLACSAHIESRTKRSYPYLWDMVSPWSTCEAPRIRRCKHVVRPRRICDGQGCLEACRTRCTSSVSTSSLACPFTFYTFLRYTYTVSTRNCITMPLSCVKFRCASPSPPTSMLPLPPTDRQPPPITGGSRRKEIASGTLNGLVNVLQITKGASFACPPLQSAVEVVLNVLEAYKVCFVR